MSCAGHREVSNSLRSILFLFSELGRGRAMVAYKKPQQRKKEESKRLRGEGDQIKLIAFLVFKDGKL